jgi:hypothetical protein
LFSAESGFDVLEGALAIGQFVGGHGVSVGEDALGDDAAEDRCRLVLT